MKVLLIAYGLVLLASCANTQTQPLIADSGFATPPLENCKTDLRYLNQVSGWQVAWPFQWQSVITAGPNLADESIRYWSNAPKSLAIAMKQLRSGINKNQTAPRPVVLRVHQQIRDLAFDLSSPNSKYSFENNKYESATTWNTLIRNDIAPAVFEFETFLRNEYLPSTNDVVGLSSINGGDKCFADAVKWWTSLSPTQNKVEEMGERILNETRAELAKTGNKGETLENILTRLRASSKSDQTTAEELVAISESALDRAHTKTLEAFARQSPDKIIVEKLPLHMQDAFPAGRYTGSQGNTPASYIINPSRPNERRLMAEVIAFHEGIPGHHLWATYPREKLPTHYNSGLAGLNEGWAIYSEYVADEMGLFTSTLDRQGMITKHLWAASRLVVEPGLHLRGWSREEAISFMLENTVMSRTEIEIEVDRYIAMPGQSLSYMIGADLIMSERQHARDTLGAAFDIAAFHEVILAGDLRPLPQVRDDIRAWAQAAK